MRLQECAHAEGTEKARSSCDDRAFLSSDSGYGVIAVLRIVPISVVVSARL